MQDIYKQDRFYVNTDCGLVIWIYHNPDANSGDQFVSNRFGIDLLREAIRKASTLKDIRHDPSMVFEYIEENCRQHLIDAGDVFYKSEKELFESDPVAVGLCWETLETLMCIFNMTEV